MKGRGPAARSTTGLAVLAAAAALAGCAQPTPAVVTSQYAGPAAPAWAAAPARPAAARGFRTRAPAPAAPVQPCRLHLAGVQDLRADTQSLGEISGRSIHAEDSAAWVDSGLQTLARDPALRIAAAGQPSDVELRVDLLKAYIISITQVKAATVVVRVHYAEGSAGDQTYRGAVDGLNWVGGEGESRAALNGALSKVVDAIHADVVNRCRALQARSS